VVWVCVAPCCCRLPSPLCSAPAPCFKHGARSASGFSFLTHPPPHPPPPVNPSPTTMHHFARQAALSEDSVSAHPLRLIDTLFSPFPVSPWE
jgi:hypothetical protein